MNRIPSVPRLKKSVASTKAITKYVVTADRALSTGAEGGVMAIGFKDISQSNLRTEAVKAVFG